MYDTPITGLVLSGGGARAAYQVGVLRAVAQIRRDSGVLRRRNPFGVICGSSAGAINAASLACHADQFDAAVLGLVQVWESLHSEQVFRADSLGLVRSGAKWLTMLSLGWALLRWRRTRPQSLLDNAPLVGLLRRLVPLQRLPRMLSGGHLHALAVSASNYNSGAHVSFYQTGASVTPWMRSQRVALPAQLEIAHLLASSAIPFIFPAIKLQVAGRVQWFGDGSIRHTAPLSSVVHLGAQRVLVIGAGRLDEPVPQRAAHDGYPSLAQIAGHTLSGIFLDALAVDVERLQRINRTLALVPEERRADTPLRHIEALVIAPSQRLDEMASAYLDSMPAALRILLRGVGVDADSHGAQGGALASYLLFTPAYTRSLIALGEADTLARRDEVQAFFGWPAGPHGMPARTPSAR